MSASRRKGTSAKVCERCGAIYVRPPGRTDVAWERRRFCGHGCSAGPKSSLADRLWRRCEPRGDCLLWTGSRSPNGYGQIGVGARSAGLMPTHRAAWYVTFGDIPPGLFVCHHCDVPLCCNPDHLFLGTHKQNMADMKVKGRGNGARGIRNANSKLADEHVAEIRLRLVPGRGGNTTALANEFGITRQYVNQLSRGVWR